MANSEEKNSNRVWMFICKAYSWFKQEKIYHKGVLFLGMACLFVYYFAKTVDIVGGAHGKAALFFELTLDLLKDIGMALLISFILISTIERITRERNARENQELLDDLSKKLLEIVYKKNIPGKLFDEVISELIRGDVIRKNHCMAFTLQQWHTDKKELQGQYVTVQATDSAIIENVNLVASEITYHAKLLLDTKADAMLMALTKINRIKIDSENLTEEEIRRYTRIDNNFLHFDYPITIKRKKSVQIVFEWNTVKRSEDSETMILVLPADGFEITLATPNRDLRVVATSMHGKELEPSELNNDVIHKWNLRYGIYPCQGVYFNWWPMELTDTKVHQTNADNHKT